MEGCGRGLREVGGGGRGGDYLGGTYGREGDVWEGRGIYLVCVVLVIRKVS